MSNDDEDVWWLGRVTELVLDAKLTPAVAVAAIDVSRAYPKHWRDNAEFVVHHAMCVEALCCRFGSVQEASAYIRSGMSLDDICRQLKSFSLAYRTVPYDLGSRAAARVH